MLDRAGNTQSEGANIAPSLTLQEQLPLVCNVADDVLFANIHASGARGLPLLEPIAAHDDIAVICGGGPSLADEIDVIREMQQHGCRIFALNNVGHFLLEHGIVVDALIMLDGRPHNARFVKGLSAKTKLYISSQCAPETFDAATAGAEIILWHAPMGGASGYLEKRKTIFVAGGMVVGVRALRMVHILGYREIHLFGMDCSLRDGEHHAYPQSENDSDRQIECTAGEKAFLASAWMIRQAEDLKNLCLHLMQDSTIGVHGDGLFPTMIRNLIAENMSGEEIEIGAEPTLLTMFYDFHVCPPGYDFLTTLAFAEQTRIERKLDGLKVVLVPGPYHGFRNDDAAPLDPEYRRQMLWGIVLGLCRCMPSVKSIVVAGSRAEAAQHVSENFYPEDYAIERPVAKYGIMHAIREMRKNDLAQFVAPKWAKEQIAKAFPANVISAPPDTIEVKPRIVTLTLRESHYVNERNSDLDIWLDAADELRSRGLTMVIVRDTERAFGEGPRGHFVFHPASYDMALRLALYEAAAVNCFAANGPWTLALFARNVNALVFGLELDGPHAMSAAHWQRRDLPVGSQFPRTHGRIKIVWRKETSKAIVEEVMKKLDRGTGPELFHACYDLGKLPANFDAATWLVLAEMDRRREDAQGPLKVAFKPGSSGGFRADGLVHAPNERQSYLDNIVRPMLPMIGAIEDAEAIDGRPYSYFMREISERARNGEEVPRLRPSRNDIDLAYAWMADHDLHRPLIFTLREATHWPKRNSNLAVWTEFAKRCGEQVLFIRDTERADEPLPGFQTCPRAAKNIGFRLALYERAKCNMLVGSGPVMLLIFSEAPYLFFRPLMDPKDVDGWPAGTPEWWRDNVGVRVGQQLPWARDHQRIVWGPEELTVIEAAWRNFMRFRIAA